MEWCVESDWEFDDLLEVLLGYCIIILFVKDIFLGMLIRSVGYVEVEVVILEYNFFNDGMFMFIINYE